jgi:hypothetical protein
MPAMGEEKMKIGIVIGAFVASVFLSGLLAAPGVAQAQTTKAECKQHLTGADRTSGPARDAMIKRYQDCLKKAKK